MTSLDEHTAKRYFQLMIRLVILLLAVVPYAAQARIGETLSECETRYGPTVEHLKPTQKASDKDAFAFSKNGITVVAEFHDGKVWRISYSKVGMDAVEVDTLLSANSAGGAWSQPLKITSQEVRTSADHNLVALFTPGKRPEATFTLVVATSDFTAANRADYEARLATIPAVLQKRNTGKGLKDF